MTEYLTLTVDKFTFRIAADRLYTKEGVWAKEESGRVRLGVSDYLQQSSGDAAFIEVQPAGTRIAAGDEFATVETIKVNLSLGSPLSGEVVETNPDMETTPEVINQDPYEKGWLAIIHPADWAAERSLLLDAEAYYQRVKQQAEDEA